MQIQVKTEFSGVQDKIDKYGSQRLKTLMGIIIRDTTPYVPMDSGELRESVESGTQTITWEAPHANILYNVPMENYTTPGTTHHWLDKAKSVHLEDWLREVERG